MISVATYKQNFKADLMAGLVVFLVALPLCLGIALASNAPIVSGLIAGIVAGLVVSFLSGSELSVSGPAAGLTVIVATAIAKLGSFEVFVGAVFLSGIMQILLGAFRLGGLSAFFPSSVIQGMLAAIGITIILKQIPHALGRDTDYEGDLDFWNITDKENTFSELWLALQSLSPTAILISTLGIALLVAWPMLQARIPKLSIVPPALLAVFLGIFLNEGVGALFPAAALNADHLVQLPAISGFGFLFDNFKLPTWETLTRPDVALVALTIALVGSLETLLCLEATDRMDPKGRASNGSRELVAQGVGNLICGFLGGIPMTSVIVRSSTNIYAGAQTRLACFFHGFFLFLSVVILAPLLVKIPLASLAAVLCVVGYKLTSPSLVRKVYYGGVEQFVPFVVTILAVIFTDLLKGVMIGLVVAFVLLLKANIYGAVVLVREGNRFLIQFTKDVSFSNKYNLRKILASIPEGAVVFIDGSKAMFIDYDVYEMIKEFRKKARSKGTQVQLLEVKGKRFSLVNRKRRKVDEKFARKAITV